MKKHVFSRATSLFIQKINMFVQKQNNVLKEIQDIKDFEVTDPQDPFLCGVKRIGYGAGVFVIQVMKAYKKHMGKDKR